MQNNKIYPVAESLLLAVEQELRKCLASDHTLWTQLDALKKEQGTCLSLVVSKPQVETLYDYVTNLPENASESVIALQVKTNQAGIASLYAGILGAPKIAPVAL